LNNKPKPPFNSKLKPFSWNNIGDGLILPQKNGHFKKYTEKWYTMQKKGVSHDRKAAGGIRGTVYLRNS
jgi:hypothetical protein